MRAVIFANGVIQHAGRIRSVVQAGDVIIAADGGALHCQKLGLAPKIVIGDFDSLDEELLSKLESQGAEIIRHPGRKEHTDLELALQHALSMGIDEILIFGALGNRWDHTLANLLLPAAESYARARIRLLDGHQEINLLRSKQTLALSGSRGDIVSLIPLWGDAHGVVTNGLEYPLANETLYFGETRGISNAFTGDTASVYLEHGVLVSVLIHNDVDYETKLG